VAKFYLTTAIDYSNGDPHLGHALEKVGADCIARYRRLRGDRVHFVMGMDEHGQKVSMAAERAGLPPQEWVDQIGARFETTWRRLLCSHDDWIRTTEARHGEAVSAFIARIQQHHPEDLFEGEYEGLYCVGCEEFKQEAQIVDGHCVEHPTLDLIPTKERNYFFRLSGYGPRLLDLIRRKAFQVEPEIRRNEILRLLENGLEDVSVSRARFPWGIPFPAAPDHTVYVWFDALINYITAAGFPDEGYDRLWPADLHIIGKGITRLHCALWPAMLLSADLPLPREVWAHGYVQWGGAKVSKSSGGAVSVLEAIERHGPDALRYFLLREVGFEGDGNFTWERFDERYTSDLADGLGNLASRSLTMIEKYRGGVVPRSAETSLDRAGTEVASAYSRAMDALDLKGGAEIAWSLVTMANQFIVQTAPWSLAKAGRKEELDAALCTLARTLARLAILACPFIPAKAQELWEDLGEPGQVTQASWSTAESPTLTGGRVRKPAGLFPKEPRRQATNG